MELNKKNSENEDENYLKKNLDAFKGRNSTFSNTACNSASKKLLCEEGHSIDDSIEPHSPLSLLSLHH